MDRFHRVLEWCEDSEIDPLALNAPVNSLGSRANRGLNHPNLREDLQKKLLADNIPNLT